MRKSWMAKTYMVHFIVLNTSRAHLYLIKTGTYMHTGGQGIQGFDKSLKTKKDYQIQDFDRIMAIDVKNLVELCLKIWDLG